MPRPPLLLLAALVPTVVSGQEQPLQDFSQVTRPVVEIRDSAVVEFILFELFIEPLAPPTHLQIIDVTQNGFGPQDLVISQPSGEAFLIPDFLSPELDGLMGTWRPDVEYRMDSGNIPLEALGALVASEDGSRRAESAIMYDLVEAVERSYRDLPLGILFVRDSVGFTFQLWDYNADAMFYQPKLAMAQGDSTVTTVVEMLRDIGYVPGRNVVGTGRTLDASGLSVASVDQTLFGIGAVSDEQVRILASRTVLLGSYDFDRSGSIDTAREIDAPGCDVWLVLESGFPAFLDRFGFGESDVPYAGNTIFSIAENVKRPAERRARACLEGREPPGTDPAAVTRPEPVTEELAPTAVRDHWAREASTAIIRAAGGVPPGSPTWAEEIRRVLLEHFDLDRSGSLDIPGELTIIPCLVWLSVAGTHDSFQEEFGFASHEGYAGHRLGVAPEQRSLAGTLIRDCGAGAVPTALRRVPSRLGSAPAPNRVGVSLEVSLQAISRIPQAEARELAAKTLILAVFDHDGSGRIDRPAELSAMTCEVWTSMEVAFPGYDQRLGITDPSRPYLGNVVFSIADVLRAPLGDRVEACREGRSPPPVPDRVSDQAERVLAIPAEVREYLDLQAAGRIVRENNGIAPGSASWASTVRDVLVTEYDSDASGWVDRSEEVAQIPCVVWSTIRETSGGTMSGLGFRRSAEYFGDRIGVDAEMRRSVAAALTSCGLE